MALRHFTEEEVQELVWGTEHGRNILGRNRWSLYVKSIVQTEDGKFYEVYWDEAATESQEHEFWEQEATEVEKITKLVEVTDWYPVEVTDNDS